MCHEKLALSQFGKNKTKKDGLQTHCIACNKQRNREWYENNKVAKIKKTGVQRKQRAQKRKDLIWSEAEKVGCHFCEENDRIVLDFHHLRDKEFDVSDGVWNVSWEKLKEEITKCVIICSNCHRRVHAGKLEVEDPEILYLE